MDLKKNIAILYFSRSAHAEAKEKSWNKFSSIKHNIRVAKNLDKQSQLVLRKVGLDVFHSNEDNQVGNSFGEKLANAYQDIYDQGYDAVISVGNDCPQLMDVNWTSICDQLERNAVVIGPTKQQGAYLIGLTKEAFDPVQFTQLSWQTKALKNELIACFSASAIFILDEKFELNNYKDLYQFSLLAAFNSTFNTFLKRLQIGRLIARKIKVFCATDLPFFQIRNLRAPPIK